MNFREIMLISISNVYIYIYNYYKLKLFSTVKIIYFLSKQIKFPCFEKNIETLKIDRRIILKI